MQMKSVKFVPNPCSYPRSAPPGAIDSSQPRAPDSVFESSCWQMSKPCFCVLTRQIPWKTWMASGPSGGTIAQHAHPRPLLTAEMIESRNLHDVSDLSDFF